jgi:hypothetical protein
MRYIVVILISATTLFACQKSASEPEADQNPSINVSNVKTGVTRSEDDKKAIIQYVDQKLSEIETSLKKNPDNANLKQTHSFLLERRKALQNK